MTFNTYSSHSHDVVLADDIQAELLLRHKHLVGIWCDADGKLLHAVVEGGTEQQQLHLWILLADSLDQAHCNTYQLRITGDDGFCILPGLRRVSLAHEIDLDMDGKSTAVNPKMLRHAGCSHAERHLQIILHAQHHQVQAAFLCLVLVLPDPSSESTARCHSRSTQVCEGVNCMSKSPLASPESSAKESAEASHLPHQHVINTTCMVF